MPFPHNETMKSMQKFFSSFESVWILQICSQFQFHMSFAQLYAPFATLKSQTFVRLPLAKVVLLVAYTKVDDVNTVNRFETWRLER